MSCAGPPPAQSAPLSAAASASASSRVFISMPSLQAWPAVEPSDCRLPSLRKGWREQLPAVASLRYWFFQNLVTHTFSDFLAPNGWFVLARLWLIQGACHTPLHRTGKGSCLATCSMNGRCMVWGRTGGLMTFRDDASLLCTKEASLLGVVLYGRAEHFFCFLKEFFKKSPFPTPKRTI